MFLLISRDGQTEWPRFSVPRFFRVNLFPTFRSAIVESKKFSVPRNTAEFRGMRNTEYGKRKMKTKFCGFRDFLILFSVPRIFRRMRKTEFGIPQNAELFAYLWLCRDTYFQQLVKCLDILFVFLFHFLDASEFFAIESSGRIRNDDLLRLFYLFRKLPEHLKLIYHFRLTKAW